MDNGYARMWQEREFGMWEWENNFTGLVMGMWESVRMVTAC